MEENALSSIRVKCEKYQNSSCQELALQKSHPPTGERAQMEQRGVEILRNDQQMRSEGEGKMALSARILDLSQ